MGSTRGERAPPNSPVSLYCLGRGSYRFSEERCPCASHRVESIWLFLGDGRSFGRRREHEDQDICGGQILRSEGHGRFIEAQSRDGRHLSERLSALSDCIESVAPRGGSHKIWKTGLIDDVAREREPFSFVRLGRRVPKAPFLTERRREGFPWPGYSRSPR